MTATKILWGQISIVFAVVLATMWLATQWTPWRLGFQPQLGPPWFELAGSPVYTPVAFFLLLSRASNIPFPGKRGRSTAETGSNGQPNLRHSFSEHSGRMAIDAKHNLVNAT